MEMTRKRLAALGVLIALIPILYFAISKIAPSPLTVSSSDSSGGANQGPFEVSLTLLEPPTNNKTVTAVISVHNRANRAWPNTSLDLILFKRTSPYVLDKVSTVWSKTERFGDMPPYGVRTVDMEVKVGEPGLYTLIAVARSFGKGFIFGNDARLFLNATEGTTAVSKIGLIEPEPPPPPYRPYIIKMDLDGVPALNRLVNLRVTIASLMDQKNATFRIFLPEGFELVSGDLVWQGDLQKGMGEGEIPGLGVAVDKIPEAALSRIPEDKKVRMRVTIRATRWGDARIFVFPSLERPSTVDCTSAGLNIPHPEGSGWLAISRGGCLNVRVFNETDAIFSEQALPPYPLPPPPSKVPIQPTPKTPPPGMKFQPADQPRG